VETAAGDWTGAEDEGDGQGEPMWTSKGQTLTIRSVLRPSSPTLLSESVSVFSSSRTERRSLLSSPMTVVSTSYVAYPAGHKRKRSCTDRRERRSSYLWFRSTRKGKGRYSRCPIQGRQGLWCRSPCSLEGEEVSHLSVGGCCTLTILGRSLDRRLLG
jgi:hypothetical protein